MSGLRIFQNREFGAVRVIEHKGEPWFVARDVCAVLGTETRDLPDILEHDEQRPIVDIIHTLNDSTGLRRDSRIISEPGLYSLVLRSRKPEAKAFKRWIVHEVIPSTRRFRTSEIRRRRRGRGRTRKSSGFLKNRSASRWSRGWRK